MATPSASRARRRSAALRKYPHAHRRLGLRRRAARRTDGQQRGRPPEPRRGAHRLSGHRAHHKAIKDGTFFENASLVETIEAAKASGGTLHLFGLTSPATSTPRWSTPTPCASWRSGAGSRASRGTRSSTGATRRRGGGRLPARRRASSWRRSASGELASAVGRYYAMDRDKRWDRVEIAWKMLTRGEGTAGRRSRGRRRGRYAATATPTARVTDEFVMPLLRKGPTAGRGAVIKDGDACFFFNFRADRARQLTLALQRRRRLPDFDRAPRPKLAAFATMTQYDAKSPCRPRSRRRAWT